MPCDIIERIMLKNMQGEAKESAWGGEAKMEQYLFLSVFKALILKNYSAITHVSMYFKVCMPHESYSSLSQIINL